AVHGPGLDRRARVPTDLVAVGTVVVVLQGASCAGVHRKSRDRRAVPRESRRPYPGGTPCSHVVTGSCHIARGGGAPGMTGGCAPRCLPEEADRVTAARPIPRPRAPVPSAGRLHHAAGEESRGRPA